MQHSCAVVGCHLRATKYFEISVPTNLINRRSVSRFPMVLHKGRRETTTVHHCLVIGNSNAGDIEPSNYAALSDYFSWRCHTPECRLSRPTDAFVRSHVRRHSAPAGCHPVIEAHIFGGREMQEVPTKFHSPSARGQLNSANMASWPLRH